MTEKITADQRHLRAMRKKVSVDATKKACNGVSSSRTQNCVADVSGADDVEMVQFYKDLQYNLTTLLARRPIISRQLSNIFKGSRRRRRT
jgi:hypothetical protein